MKAPPKNSSASEAHDMTRRRFLAAAGASAISASVLNSGLVFGAEAKARIKLGLIGCGGRGKWIAQLFQKHGGYDFVAVADYFQERVDTVGEEFRVPVEKRFTGLNGYRRLLDQKLDAVAIESPPYFHPEQAAAAVDAGKHVYLAKPVAVDVPGCLSIEESGKMATAKRLCFLVDFQTRANGLYQAAEQKIREGEIGKIISAEAAYHCGFTWEHMDQALRKNPDSPEMRLRAWGLDRVLSGDVITEQNIHALDVACWMLDAHPLKAYGSGGQKRGFLGTCWDVFSVIFYFPEDILVSFNSHQSGYGYDDIMCRVFGIKGVVDTHYFGNVSVKAREFRSDGKVESLYQNGAVANIATFYDSITSGQCDNPTVAQSVRSNLTTILGRTAAYKNEVVTWDEMMRSREKFVADLKGLKA